MVPSRGPAFDGAAEVVPTQMTRPPLRLVSLIRSAVSCGMTQYSLCISWPSMVSSFTWPEGAEPYMECHVSNLYTIVCTRSRSSGVK